MPRTRRAVNRDRVGREPSRAGMPHGRSRAERASAFGGSTGQEARRTELQAIPSGKGYGLVPGHYLFRVIDNQEVH